MAQLYSGGFPEGMGIQRAGAMPLPPAADADYYGSMAGIASDVGTELQGIDTRARQNQEQQARINDMIEKRRIAIAAQRARQELADANREFNQAKLEEMSRHSQAQEQYNAERAKELTEMRKEQRAAAEKARDRASKERLERRKFQQQQLAQKQANAAQKDAEKRNKLEEEDFKDLYPDLDDRSLSLLKKVKTDKYSLGQVQRANEKAIQTLEKQVEEYKTDPDFAAGNIRTKKTAEKKSQELESRIALRDILTEEAEKPAVEGGVPRGEVGTTEEEMEMMRLKQWLNSEDALKATPQEYDLVKKIVDDWERKNAGSKGDLSVPEEPAEEEPEPGQSTWGPGGEYPPETLGPERF